LPYPVRDDAEMSKFERLRAFVAAVYGDEPELSVYTNGQNIMNNVVIARYRLFEAGDSTPERHRLEYEEVVGVADRLHGEIEAELANGWHDESVLEIGEDGTYAMLAYGKLASMSTYSDDVDDSPHANDIYGALVEGETKCYGMACAMKALLNRRGIPSFIATGSLWGSEDERHAWVVIRDGGCWRVLDVTVAQGHEPPEGRIDVEGLLHDDSGYWNGCLKPLDDYMGSFDATIDASCMGLMVSYEELISDVH